jgi:hypothetical protein
MLTGKWVIADDRVLVMRWTEQERGQELEQELEQEREVITLAA